MSPEEKTYLLNCTNNELIRIIQGFQCYQRPLGYDADIRFQPYEEDENYTKEAGYYCSHTGENILDFKD
jgi:hypothetical protein